MTDTTDLIQRLSDEADLCRNDGATDIAGLLDEAQAALEQQAAQIEALRADAERYRWLKKNRQTESYDGDIGIDFTCDFDNFSNIDASIDAAMKVKP